MYRSSWFTAVILASVFAGSASSQAPTPLEVREPVFALQISLKERTIKPGADLTVKVELVNTTDKEIRVASFPQPYTIDVLDHSGKSAPLTPRGRMVLKRERIVENGKTRIYVGGSSWTIRIPPRGIVIDAVVVSDFFSLSQPGEYTLRLRRPDTETNQLVTSNSVTVTVASDSPRPNNPEK